MKYIVRSILIIALAQTATGVEIPPDAVIVTVNGEPILHRQVEREIETLAREGYPPPVEEVFSQLIARKLLHQAAVKQSLTASEAEIEEALAAAASRAGSSENLEKELAASGDSLEDLKKLLREQIEIGKAIDARIGDRAKVTDATAEEYYLRNPGMFEIIHARHILRRAPEDAAEEDRNRARQEIEKIADRLAAGEDFAELARQESEDPGTAPKGGDLGSIHRGEMVPSFEEAAFSLQPGQTSEVVETRFGFHLIRVDEKKTIIFEEARETIRQALERAIRDRLTDQWVLELQKESRIEFNPEFSADR